jgi:glycosyltransferase involved in cell wall biosynthesis
MGEHPAISILLTAYNHERFVEQALDSVLAQTYHDFELIITDDCSLDGSRARIQGWLDRTGFPARVIANDRNVGIAVVRNQALAVATGEFVCSLAGDDFYEPDRLARQHAAFRGLGPEVAAVYSDERVIDVDGVEVSPSYLHRRGVTIPPPEGEIRDLLLSGNFLPAPAVMIRRSALDAVGPYDESLVFEDYDMWLRLADRYQFRFVPGALVNYRILSSSLSRAPSRRAEMAESNFAILLKWSGRSPATDPLVAYRLWRIGWAHLGIDRARGRSMLDRATDLGVSRTRRLLTRLLRVPGLDRLASVTVAAGARRDARSWARRNPRSS